MSGVTAASRGTTTGGLSVVVERMGLGLIVVLGVLDSDHTPVVMVMGAGLEQSVPVLPGRQKQVPALVQTLMIRKV